MALGTKVSGVKKVYNFMEAFFLKGAICMSEVRGRKIKILFVISIFAYGAGKALIEIMKHLDPERFSCSVAILWRTPGDLVPELGPEVRAYDLGAKKTRLASQVLRLVSTLKRTIREADPDVVAGLLLDANIISALACRTMGRRPKVVLCEHTSPIPRHTDLYGTGLLGRMALKTTSIIYSLADAVVAVSKGLERELKEIGLPQSKLRTIYTPVDLEIVRALSKEDSGIVRPYILYVGQLVPFKNVGLLVDAFSIVAGKCDLDLVLVGGGSERAALEARAEAAGIAKRVRFVGFDKNPYKYMRGAQMFVFPSNTESFGLVLLEAMACGCPVITTDSLPDTADIVEDGVNGLVVPCGNASLMARAILTLHGNQDLRERFVAASMGKILGFDPEAQSRLYEELFEELASSRIG